MSSLTVPKRGDAARMLAELNAEDAPSGSTEQPSAHTDARTHGRTDDTMNGHTDIQTPAYPSVQIDGNTETRTDGQPPVIADVKTPARPSSRKVSRPSAQTAALTDGDFVGRVKARIASREPLEGGAKTTLEYSPEMSRRLKQYCLDKGSPKDMNGRVVLTALLSTFLEEEGY